MKRRPKGSVQERGHNCYELKFDVPRDGGARRTRYVSFKGTKDEAEAKLIELLDKARKGLVRGQIIPHLKMKLQKLTPDDVERWHATLNGTGLSSTTINNVHRLLRCALGQAVRKGTLAVNAAALVSAPARSDTEFEILEPEQIEPVLDALKGHKLYPIVALAIYTGMRRGELLALQWDDVDLDAGTVTVRRSLEQTAAGIRIKEPKTKRADARSGFRRKLLTCSELTASKWGAFPSPLVAAFRRRCSPTSRDGTSSRTHSQPIFAARAIVTDCQRFASTISDTPMQAC